MSIVSHDVLHQFLGLGTLRTLGVNGQSVNHDHPSCNLEVYHHVNTVKEAVLCKQSLSLKGGKNHIFLAIIDYAKLIIIVPICQKVASYFRKEHISII